MVKVKKAIIPAAGFGSRMYPYTKKINKLMLPLLNKPVVHYLVDELERSGIKEIIISGRYLKSVSDYFKKNKKFDVLVSKYGKEHASEKIKSTEKKISLIFLEQPQPKGWVYELKNAKRYLKKEPFVVMFSDVLWHSEIPVTKQLISLFNKTKQNICSRGRFVFSPKIFELISGLKFKLGDPNKTTENHFMSLVLKNCLNQNNIKGKTFDIGNPIEYFKTFVFFSLHSRIKKDCKTYMKEILKKRI